MNDAKKAAAWDEGYKAGRDAGGMKGIPVNPHQGTECESAWLDGYSVGLDDAWKCAKTGRAFENPYRVQQ